MHSSRGPERVAQQLISNLEKINIELKSQIDWILNVNSSRNLLSIDIGSTNLILGPNVEFEQSHVKQKIQNVKNVVILVPSEWVIAVLKERLDWYAGKYLVWPSDVNLNYWKPSWRRSKRYILIYRKNDEANDDYFRVTSYCAQLGLKYKTITYGAYSPHSFRKHLRRSHFAIWLGTTESQGIALLEAWAANVPTLVRQKNVYFDEVSGQHFASSTAPYLTEHCGRFFDSENFDSQTLNEFARFSKNLEPRRYVQEHYSKSQAERKLIGIFQVLNS